MFVERLLSAAREKLAVVEEGATLIEAAKLLLMGIDLVMVRGSTGTLIGVVTKTDIVAQISRCDGAVCKMPASLAMTRDVLFCQPSDSLNDVWAKLKERGLRNIPVVDREARPLGVVHARNILEVLLEEAEDEDAMLREYVMGVGYLN